VDKTAVVPPPQSLSSDERAAFWGDIDKPRRTTKHAETRVPLPDAPEEEVPRPAPEPPRRAPVPVDAGQEVAEAARSDRAAKAAVEGRAVRVSPTGAAEEVPQVDTPGVGKSEQVLLPDEVEVKDDFAPRLPKRSARRRKKPPRISTAVMLQTPEEYDGEVTSYPEYLKAVLFGLLVGLLLAGAYAGFEYWRHSGRWILGWILGFVVGIVVVFASGRHFNWQLGVVSAVITWFSLCIGQISFSLLDVRFNSIFPLKLPFPTLLHQAVNELWSTLGSWWLIMFIMAGAVAFVVSFRPWPVRFQVSPPQSEGEVPESSEPDVPPDA
jgi:cellulose synthase/poly-beta-1,6-N-acetylglucosamine synthase-like glycosyltransferase